MESYRRFYRHLRKPFAGAGAGTIYGVTTLARPSSISYKHTASEEAAQLNP
jgi:hypothetical protein